MSKSAELTDFELYNLKDDLGETKDLKEEEPERFQSMLATLQEMYHEVREESPVWPEWVWPKYESERIKWLATRGQRGRQ